MRRIEAIEAEFIVKLLRARGVTVDGRLQQRAQLAEGRDYTVALYPGAEHGMTEYELDAKGERVSTRFPVGYFAMMRDFARDGRLGGDYGRAAIDRPAARR